MISRSSRRRRRRSRNAPRQGTWISTKLRRMEATMQQLRTSSRRWETRALLGEAALAKARHQAAEWQTRVDQPSQDKDLLTRVRK